MSTKRRSTSSLKKQARKGFRGYPIATVAYYGPDDKVATKVAVGIVAEDDRLLALEKWYSEDRDIRFNSAIDRQILEFIRSHHTRSVVITEGIIGCPHEEGIDYPEGASCPHCPYWANRDRWTDELVH